LTEYHGVAQRRKAVNLADDGRGAHFGGAGSAVVVVVLANGVWAHENAFACVLFSLYASLTSLALPSSGRPL